jgi:hypothetical protein
MNDSSKTAIHRKNISAPAKWLRDQQLIVGCSLDYGCGHGVDADTIGMDKYDLNWHPEMPEGTFDTITCTYVLNVIESEQERQEVLDDIISRLSLLGTAYVTVRADSNKLNGVTKTGSWQGNIMLDSPWELLRSVSGYRIYRFTKV